MGKVIIVFRKPYTSAYSIEYLFNTIYEEIIKKKPVYKYTLPYFTRELKGIFLNTISLAQFRNQTIHITGDVYYAILGAWFCKRIITIHDLSFLSRTKGMKRKIMKLFWITLPARFSHRITVVSGSTKKALLEQVRVHPEKIQVIYNFIDPIFAPATRMFNSDCPGILQVGTNFNK